MKIQSALNNVLVLLMFLFLFCISLFTYPIEMVYAENEGNKVRVYGFVFDYNSNEPLYGVKITAAEQLSRQQLGEQRSIAETNASGFFEGYVEALKNYVFFAYYDDPSTPGVDYVPARKEVFVG